MAEALEIRVLDLVSELLAHALRLRSAFQAAGTITAGLFQTILDRLHHLLVRIQRDFHRDSPPFAPAGLIPMQGIFWVWISGGFPCRTPNGVGGLSKTSRPTHRFPQYFSTMLHNALFSGSRFPQPMQVAVGKHRFHLVTFANGEGHFGLIAGLQSLALIALLCLEGNPFNVMLLNHGMGH